MDWSSQEETEQPGSPAGSESSTSREVCLLVPTAQRGSELMENKRAQLRRTPPAVLEQCWADSAGVEPTGGTCWLVRAWVSQWLGRGL